VTEKQVISASGAPSLKVHSTIDADFPLVQSLDGAHALGCHHVVTDGSGTRAVSAGFAGDVKVWSCQDGYWSADTTSSGTLSMIIAEMPFANRETRSQSEGTECMGGGSV